MGILFIPIGLIAIYFLVRFLARESVSIVALAVERPLAVVVAVVVLGISSYNHAPQSREVSSKPAGTPAATVAGGAVAAKTTPSSPQASNRVVALRGDDHGHFVTDLMIGGQFVKAVVDTGASVVAIPYNEAQRLKILPAASQFTVPLQTANGKAFGAMARIPELRIQGITLYGVDAVVMPKDALGITLLGMSFLKRLKSFEMNGGTLVLKQ